MFDVQLSDNFATVQLLNVHFHKWKKMTGQMVTVYTWYNLKQKTNIIHSLSYKHALITTASVYIVQSFCELFEVLESIVI